MTHLSGIIERLEKAAGPDRELDDEIAFAVLGDGGTVRLEGQPDDAPPMRTFTYLDGTRGTSLRYTSSIDAALTLVPEGWSAILYTQTSSVEFYQRAAAPRKGIQIREHVARTLPINICIAALRSRSHKET